jgi:uncharacterized lipoprotein YddW (UPF0748 family)
MILSMMIVFPVFCQQEPLREFRATWIATVSNLDWPKYEDRNNPDRQMADLERILDQCELMNLNAVFLQVRSECDALYRSSYEPWSRYLTGTQGQDPGYDPLQFAVGAAHARGIELHVWLNPYRINASTSDGQGYYHSSHVYVEHPEWAMVYSTGKKILNPGLPEVMVYIGEVVRDIITTYPVDGVHFDDYFYSYNGTSNSLDQDQYNAYGNSLSRGDWRRANINQMIETVYRVIQEVNPDIRFGVSPFGIYRNGVPSGISGLDAYSTIYCDPLAWLDQQTVDYITPQMYWPTGGSQDFRKLAAWWSTQVIDRERHLFTGHGIYKMSDNPGNRGDSVTSLQLDQLKDDSNGTIHEEKTYMDSTMNYSTLEGADFTQAGFPATWSLGEIGRQIDIVRLTRPSGGIGISPSEQPGDEADIQWYKPYDYSTGNVFFRASDFDRVQGLAGYLRENKYTHKTLLPEMTWKHTPAPRTPDRLTFDGETIRWEYSGLQSDRFAVYASASDSEAWIVVSNAANLVRTVFEQEIQVSGIEINDNYYVVVTALSASGVESKPSETMSIINQKEIRSRF